MSTSRPQDETLALFLSGAERLETAIARLNPVSLDLDEIQ